jgi:predicted membrane channel-forming protein YqfA (hemolysin III family)
VLCYACKVLDTRIIYWLLSLLGSVVIVLFFKECRSVVLRLWVVVACLPLSHYREAEVLQLVENSATQRDRDGMILLIGNLEQRC